jgi:hypothetical protein
MAVTYMQNQPKFPVSTTLEDVPQSNDLPANKVKPVEPKRLITRSKTPSFNEAISTKPHESLFELVPLFDRNSRRVAHGEYTPIPFLTRGMLSLVVGPGGTGKSLLMLHLGLSIILNRQTNLDRHHNGTTWCLRPSRKRNGRVALIFGEEDSHTCNLRIGSALKESHITPQDYDAVASKLHLYPLAGMGNISFSEDELDEKMEQVANDLIQDLNGDEEGYDLVVLDPLVKFGPAGFETDNVQAARFMATMDKLISLPGKPTVLLVHHSSKGGMAKSLYDAGRGSSALTNAARIQAILRRIGDEGDGETYLKDLNEAAVVEFRITKSNHSATGLSVRFSINQGRLTLVQGDEYLQHLSRDEAKGDTKPSTKAKPSRPNKQTTNQAIWK